ncbi:MAG: N-acetylmuramoyl-L-alanine amidase, partial [Bacteroidaceae bacterium]|nr:N-acetylmuramoyl-L-alanine amidase [Bacteroidaceae bacterium]
NNTYPPAILIELDNIRNSRDLKRIIIEDNRQAMANWMREALIKDYKSK